MHFFHEVAIFWSAEIRCKDIFPPTLHHLSQVIFATATVVAFVPLRNSRFNFHCIHSPNQRLLRSQPGSDSCDLSRLLARKITMGIHSCDPASLNRPVVWVIGSSFTDSHTITLKTSEANGQVPLRESLCEVKGG